MPKFFVTQDKISDNQIIIDSEDVTHISRVLRLEKGDNVTVCDGQGTDYDAQIDTIEPKKILLNIVSRQKRPKWSTSFRKQRSLAYPKLCL